MLVAIALGVAAAVGGMARYGLDTLIRQGEPGVHGIVVVNILGSLLLGFLTALAGVLTFTGAHFAAGPITPPPAWFTILGIGFCGAFTTFSTATLDVLAYLRTHHWTKALALVTIGVVTAVLAAGLGIVLGTIVK